MGDKIKSTEPKSKDSNSSNENVVIDPVIDPLWFMK